MIPVETSGAPITSAMTSDVPLLGNEEEAARLKTLAVSPPPLVLVVSDLHLGPGRDPVTGRFARTENFFAGESFAGMLDHNREAAARGALLVLNGDSFDFLRLTDVPSTPAEMEAWSIDLARLGVARSPQQLAAGITRREERFGLRTDDYKSVWKLLRIARGHPAFVAALAAWLAAGGRIAFVKGNHDLELHWPLVRMAVRDQLVRHGALPAAAGDGVLFCEEWLCISNLYIEHGHRFEAATAVPGSPTLPGRPSQLSLPLGSFVNRYLVNPVERLEPFIDNVKPVKDLLWALVRRHPLQAVGILWRSWRFLLRAAQARQWRQGLAFALFFGSLAVPLLTAVLIVAAIAIPAAGARSADLLGRYQGIAGVVGLLFPFLVGVVRDLVPRRRPPVGEDRYAEGAHAAVSARCAARPARVRYAVMGHTHVQDMQSLPPVNGAPVFYLNCGTWTPLWQADRPDLQGRTLHPLVRFTLGPAGEYTHEYLEWQEQAGRPTPGVVLAPAR